MSSLEYANQKLYEAWLCLFGDRDEKVNKRDCLKNAMLALAPGMPAIKDILVGEDFTDADRDDMITVGAAGALSEIENLELFERALVRLDRAVMRVAANAPTRLVHVL